MSNAPLNESPLIRVSGIDIEWDIEKGTCEFSKLPVAMMWVDTTLAGLLSGVQAMVGTERFALALQSEGRKSVETDWQVISQFTNFRDGFAAIANIAAVAGWGKWLIEELDQEKKTCRFRVFDSWEGRYQKALRVSWGSAMLAGKMAGYCTKLFGVNCWAEQVSYISDNSDFDEFVVKPSSKSVESEIDCLLVTNKATQADMAVALHRLSKEIEQRVLAEEELRESETRYRALFESSHDGVFLHNGPVFVECNQAALDLVKATDKTQVIGHTPIEFTVEDPDSPQSAFEMMSEKNAAVLSGEPQIFEWPVRRLDGAELLVEIHLTPVVIQGKLLSQAICRDITERKKIENALRASEEKYRGIFDDSVATIYIFDKNKRFIDSNQAGLNLLGYSREELLQMRIPDVDADPKVVLPAHEELLAGERIVNYEHDLRHKDGSIISVLNNSQPIKNEKGDVIGMLSTLVDITDRKRAERSVQETATRYRSLLDNLPQLIWQKDKEGVYESCNSAYANNFDFSHDDIAGKTDYDLYPIELAKKYIADDQHIIASRQIEAFDERWLKGTEERIVHTTKIPLRNAKGDVFGTLGIAEDITERSRAEEALREREEIMSAIVSQAGDAIELVNLETFRIVEFNDTAYTTLGYTRGEYAQLTVFDIQGEFKEEQLISMVETIPMNGNMQVENKHRCKNGCLIDVQVNVRKIKIRGHPHAVAVWRDITEQKRNTQELERYRQQLEQLVEERTVELKAVNQQLLDTHFAMGRSGIGIHWVDAKTGKLLYVNSYAAQLLGYSEEEMLELTIPDIDPNFPPGDFQTNTRELFASGPAHFESQERAKDGTLIPVEISGYWLPAAKDTSSRFITFVSDITYRKQIEHQILSAKIMAEQANLAKSIFLANMSHEIRTPMNGVIGMTDVLLTTSLTEDQRKMARVIRDSAQTQLGILNDILDFSKIEAGKLEFSIEPFALAEVVEKTCATLAAQARQTGVMLRQAVEPHIPPLEGDALRVRQILSNFLGNAIKFSSGLERPGEVEVSARLAGEADGRVWVELAVRDNGIGMDAATRERVFHPFAQADASTTRQYGGTGLGLVISTRLVAMMGGEIRVESTPGVGSTFTARLPFPRADETALAAAPATQDRPPPPAIVPGRAEAIAQGQLILVAEDNATNQEVIRQQLILLGYRCDIAPDGQEAFRQWLTGEYGLILSDLHMPHLDGYQLVEAIRREETNRGGTGHIPILALTANVLKGEAERCQAAGMDGYLAKPTPLSQLQEQLVHWLPAAAAPSPADQTAETPARAAADADELPVFDPSTLTRMVGDNPAIQRRLLEKFQVTAQTQAERLRAAVTGGDTAAVGQIAHGLKSNARAIGALQLGQVCEKLEHAGKAADRPVVTVLFPAFESAFEVARETIDSILVRA